MRTCYDEANRLANHGSSGLEKLVMTQLYDAANAAKEKLNDALSGPRGGEGAPNQPQTANRPDGSLQ